MSLQYFELKDSKLTSFSCNNSNLKVFKIRKEPCIGITQENLIEFQLQSVLLVYTLS